MRTLTFRSTALSGIAKCDPIYPQSIEKHNKSTLRDVTKGKDNRKSKVVKKSV